MVKIALGLPLVAICLAHLWLVGCCVSLPVLVTGEASIGDEDSGGKRSRPGSSQICLRAI